MNPVQGVPAAHALSFSAASELAPPTSGAPTATGASTAGLADTTGRGAASVSWNALDPNTASAAGPGGQSGGFFAVLQNLMDQLDTMIGQLLGTPATPVPGTGPVPGDGASAPPPDGAPVPAPANREPL
jgi:hypothetical protein